MGRGILCASEIHTVSVCVTVTSSGAAEAVDDRDSEGDAP